MKNFRMKYLFLITILLKWHPVYALPFNITPLGTLPTTVVSGETATAIYTVQNNTSKVSNNSFVKYLPLNVTQVTNEGGYCGRTFNLQPFGQAGDSCSLKLSITGAVDASDPDPHHHLFVCRSDGTTCAGTNYPLNVTVTEPPPPPSGNLIAFLSNGFGTEITICFIASNGTFNSCIQKNDASFGDPVDVISSTLKLYVANSDTDTLSICDKLPTGIVGNCQTFSDSSFRLISAGLRLNAANTLLYVTNYNTNSVSICSVNSSTGLVTSCSSTAAIFNGPQGRVTFNATGTVAYIANFSNDSISICQVNTDGTFGSCTFHTDPLITEPAGLATDVSGKYLYVTASTAVDAKLLTCPIQSNGTLGACVNNTGVGAFDFDQYISNLFLNDEFAWVPNYGAEEVLACPLNSNGSVGTCNSTANWLPFSFFTSVWVERSTARLFPEDTLGYLPSEFDGFINVCSVGATGTLSDCIYQVDNTFNGPSEAILNSAKTMAYIANEFNGSLSVCPVSSGLLSACSAFTDPLISALFETGLQLNPQNSRLYFTHPNSAPVSVEFCPVNSDGSLSSCSVASTQFFKPLGRIAFNLLGTTAYVADQGTPAIWTCPVNSDGTFGVCTSFTDSLIVSPLSVAINGTDSVLYIYDTSAPDRIVNCTINAGTLTACTSNLGNGTFSFGSYGNFFVDSQTNLTFIPNSNTSNPTRISSCPINDDGTLGLCLVSSLSRQTATSTWVAHY